MIKREKRQIVTEVAVCLCDRCGAELETGEAAQAIEDADGYEDPEFEIHYGEQTIVYRDLCGRCDAVLARLWDQAGPIRKAREDATEPPPTPDPPPATPDPDDGQQEHSCATCRHVDHDPQEDPCVRCCEGDGLGAEMLWEADGEGE